MLVAERTLDGVGNDRGRAETEGRNPASGVCYKAKEAPEAKVKSLLCLPLRDDDRPVGVVNISTINFHKSFEKSDIDIAHQLAKRMVGIIKNL